MNKALLLICTLYSSIGSFCQNTYSITQNTSTSSNPFPSQCTDCTINISTGVTLTVNSDIYLQNSSFNGGNILVTNKKITFWTTGAFNNVKARFEGTGGLVTSQYVTINNSQFNFVDNSTAIVYSSLTMLSSRMSFINNARMEATSGNFELKNNSSLSAGNGSTSSTSYIKFNGASLQGYDNFYVSVNSYNNYYWNWSNYTSLSNNKSYSTQNNNLNCGNGKNPCANPYVYGPATLNSSGISPAATLPVRLSSFDAKYNSPAAVLTWTTASEVNTVQFLIERSSDSKNWVSIGNVNASGSAHTISHYSFTDKNPGQTDRYYRLKIFDQDNSFQYSPVKLLPIRSTQNFFVYPNPASDQFVVSTGKKTGTMVLEVIDALGRVLQRESVSDEQKVKLKNIRPGVYNIRLTVGTTDTQQCVLLVK